MNDVMLHRSLRISLLAFKLASQLVSSNNISDMHVVLESDMVPLHCGVICTVKITCISMYKKLSYCRGSACHTP